MLLLYALLNVMALILCVLAKRQLDGFLGTHPFIESQRDISDFKQLARTQMYMALVQLAVLGTTLILGLALIWRGGFGMFLLVLMMNGIVFVAARWAKATEVHVQSLRCATSELAQARQSIVDTWKKKPLPDF